MEPNVRIATEMTDLAAAVEMARTQRLIPPAVVVALPAQDDLPEAPAEVVTTR
jgi:hypothetical protein